MDKNGYIFKNINFGEIGHFGETNYLGKIGLLIKLAIFESIGHVVKIGHLRNEKYSELIMLDQKIKLFKFYIMLVKLDVTN